MDHLDLAGVLTTPPQWNLSAFEQQDAIYLSSSRQMLEPIMEETSEDEEYALNSWQQYEQESSDAECEAATEGESICGGTGCGTGASFWSSAESDTGSVIRVEINKDNDSTSERDFLCPAKRPRRCEESLAQSLNEDEVILRRPYADLMKNNSLERFLNYENFSRDSWGANSQQRSSVGSRRGFDDFYSDSDSLSYNSLSRSSSLIQFESLERQLLLQEQHASMNSLGNSSPSLLSFENNEENATKAASNSGNNSANNSRRGSQASLLKKYESLDGRLHQTYYDLDKLNFDDMNHTTGDTFARTANLKISSHMAELRSDSEYSSEGSEGSSRAQSVLSPNDCHDNDFMLKNINSNNSQQSKKGKSSAENLSEDSGYCEPSLGFGLRRSKSQSLLKNYEKFSEEEEEMENKSLIHNNSNNNTHMFIELNAEQQANNHKKHSVLSEFKNIAATSQETIVKSPPLSPQLEFIRHKQRTEAHSPSPVSSEVSTSSSTSSHSSTNSNNSNTSCTSSSSASSTSSATTCASKASFTWLMPSSSNTATQSSTCSSSSSSSSAILAEEENSTSQISLNDLRELQTSNSENVQVCSGKLENNFENISFSNSATKRAELAAQFLIENENECLECKNILDEELNELNECRNCGEKVFLKTLLKHINFCCQKCKENSKHKENFKNKNEIRKGNGENSTIICKNCGEQILLDFKLTTTFNEKVRKKLIEQQIQLITDKSSSASIKFVDTEINESNCLAVSTPESLKKHENSAKTVKNHKNYNKNCSSSATPETCTRLLKTCPLTLGYSANSSDSDYSPLRLRKNFHNLMPSWPVKTSSVPNELNAIGRKKKLKKTKTAKSNQTADHTTTDSDSLTSSEELNVHLLNIKRSSSWCFEQNLDLETPSFCADAKNLGLLHQSYHNLALLNLEVEQENYIPRKMSAEKRNSSDYEAEIVCKNNFLLDELSAHFDRTASILNDKQVDETDAVDIKQVPEVPQRMHTRKSSNSSCTATEDSSEAEQIQHVSLVIRKPPARQKRERKVEEKVNSLTQDYSFAAIMQSGIDVGGGGGGSKTFDQDPTVLKTSYAQSLEKCNFDCRELSTQDLGKTRALPKRRFHSQANSAKKKNLVSSTPNLNAYDFNHQDDDIEDDMFVSSAHTSMHQLPLTQTQKPLGILLPAGSRTSFGKEVSFCPVVSKYCWQEQSSEECNEEQRPEPAEDESEDELLDNADATVIYNTKENENIASKYNEEFLKREVPDNNYQEHDDTDNEVIKEKATLNKEINSIQQMENIKLTKESSPENCGNETQSRADTAISKHHDNNETAEHNTERSELLITATQSSNEPPPVTTVSLTTNVNNDTLNSGTDTVLTEQNKRVHNLINTNKTISAPPPTVVVARPLSIQLPILSEPPINRAHHILYASQQMLDNFQKQQQNEEFEHFKSQSTQNLSKMSGKISVELQKSQQQQTQTQLLPASNSKLNNNNEIMKSKFKHEEKHPNSKGFLSRFANGFRFSLRRNKKKLQQKENQDISNDTQEQQKTNGQTNQNKSTKSLPAGNKQQQQADFIHIPLKGPLPANRNGNTARPQTGNGSSSAANSNGNAKNINVVLLKQKGAKIKETNDKQQQKVTGKPPIPPQQQQQIQQFHKMQSAQSSQLQQQQPLVEVGLSRFYTETESNNHPATALHAHTVTQDFLTSERGFYNENHHNNVVDEQHFTTTTTSTSRQSCANNQPLTTSLEEKNVDANMTAVNANNTVTYEFTSPSRASVSQKTQMFNNLSRKSDQPKIGLIETNLDTHETIITGKTRSLINIGPHHQQQQQRYAGNKRLHTNTNSYNNHQQQFNRHHLCDGNEADDDDYDDNDDDEVVVRPDGTVVVIKNAGTKGSSSSTSQAAQIVSVRRPHKSMEFLLDKENQKDVMTAGSDFPNVANLEPDNANLSITSARCKKKLLRSMSLTKCIQATDSSDSDNKSKTKKQSCATTATKSNKYSDYVRKLLSKTVKPTKQTNKFELLREKVNSPLEVRKTCTLINNAPTLPNVSKSLSSHQQQEQPLQDSFIDQGFETCSNYIESPLKSSLEGPENFSTPSKANKKQTFPIINSILDNKSNTVTKHDANTEDSQEKLHHMPAVSYSHLSEDFCSNYKPYPANVATQKSASSQFWVALGDFTAALTIQYCNSRSLSRLRYIFGKRSLETQVINFGIDNQMFCLDITQPPDNIIEKVPQENEYSQYWFSTGSLLIPFRGKPISSKQIQHFFDYIRECVESLGSLKFGIDNCEFSNAYQQNLNVYSNTPSANLQLKTSDLRPSGCLEDCEEEQQKQVNNQNSANACAPQLLQTDKAVLVTDV